MKKLLFCILCSVFSCLCFAQNSISDFFRGNLEEKNQVILNSSCDENVNILLAGMDFLLTSDQYLYDDPEYSVLAENVIKGFTPKKISGMEKNVSSLMCSLFTRTKNAKAKVALMDSFYSLNISDSLPFVNDFFYKQMQNHGKMDESVLKAIDYMGKRGNSSSFNRLFIADILEIWPEYNSVIADAYGKLSENNRKEIVQMVVSVPADKKIVILNKLRNNSKISREICGECAENVLQSVINNNGEENPKEKKEDILELKLLCLEIIANSQWTRAAVISTKSFEKIRQYYENNLISAEQFSKAIENISKVSTSETVVVLSSYLDFLNKCTENNQPPAGNIVLSVIKSLGELGDNRAFDFIYAATTLDYPEEIVEAARSANEKLKW